MKIAKKWSTLLLPILLAGCMSTATTTPETDGATNPSVEEPSTKPDVKPEQKPQVDPKPPVKPEANELKTADGKLLLGEEEWIYIKAINHSAKARIDTGATTSSISAVDIEMFERDGKKVG